MPWLPVTQPFIRAGAITVRGVRTRLGFVAVKSGHPPPPPQGQGGAEGERPMLSELMGWDSSLVNP